MPSINRTFLETFTPPADQKEREFWIVNDDKLPGFRVRISKSGVKSYQVKARIKGGESIIYTIGNDGHKGMNAESARKEAKSVLSLMGLGLDPREENKRRKAEEGARKEKKEADDLKATLTLRKAFEEWRKNDRKTKDSTKTLYQQVTYKHLADWLDAPMAEITADMVAQRYAKVSAITAGSANNTFRALRMLFNWYIVRQEDLPESQQIFRKNPVTVLHRRDMWEAIKPRTAFVTANQLPAWFGAVDSLENDVYRDFFLFLLLTGLRLSEAASLRWEHVDFDNKVFTAVDTKNGSDHTLPMTPFIEALLRRRRNDSPCVFPGKGAEGHLCDTRHWIDVVTERSGVDFTCHQLRRTFSNMAMDVNLSDGHRKMLLNHSDKSDVTQEHYTSKDAERMHEPLQLVEQYILRLARVNNLRKKRPASSRGA
jgi:integrase